MPIDRLIINHLGKRRFRITRASDGNSSSPVELTPPSELSVEGQTDSNLLQDWHWYLERFLDHPFEPDTNLAARVLDALSAWGRETFARLFTGPSLLWYDRVGTSEDLVLEIVSDDPRVLAWPWEALRDPYGATLAHAGRLERRLDQGREPLPLPSSLPHAQLNILLVMASLYLDPQTGFHPVSSALVDWRRQQRGVNLDMLRPPTFAALKEHLATRQGYYHVVHFDGHGGIAPDGHSYLMFEDAAGRDDPVPASQFMALFAEHGIPIVVLAACRPARSGSHAEDPFAATAAALLKGGIRSVLTLSPKLRVSGAQRFIPAFYGHLLEAGEVAEAMRAGRKALLEHSGRACGRGEYALQDWMIPMLYRQAAVQLPVRADAELEACELPEEARDFGTHGCIGRMEAIQHLDWALRQDATTILIHGSPGVGKTTLVKGLLNWLWHTSGIGAGDDRVRPRIRGVLWFSFADVRSVEVAIDRMAVRLIDVDALGLPMSEKLSALIKALREQPIIMVWDHVQAGVREGTAISSLLTHSEVQPLKQLLDGLRGGRCKVLITSRTPENWLDEVPRLALPGLFGEDAWAYCNAVARELQLQIAHHDPQVHQLLKLISGHPRVLRSVLWQLHQGSAGELLQQYWATFKEIIGTDSECRMLAGLALSAAIEEAQGNEQYVLSACRQLGSQTGYEVRERWFKKALAIEDRLGGGQGAPDTHFELATLAQSNEDAAERYLHAARGFANRHDQNWFVIALSWFVAHLQATEPPVPVAAQAKLRAAWKDLDLEQLISLEALEAACQEHYQQHHETDEDWLSRRVKQLLRCP